jgi:hypothetical protein
MTGGPCPDCRAATDRADARLCSVGAELRREWRDALSRHWEVAGRAMGTFAEVEARKDVMAAKDRYFSHLRNGWCPEPVVEVEGPGCA